MPEYLVSRGQVDVDSLHCNVREWNRDLLPIAHDVKGTSATHLMKLDCTQLWPTAAVIRSWELDASEPGS